MTTTLVSLPGLGELLGQLLLLNLVAVVAAMLVLPVAEALHRRLVPWIGRENPLPVVASLSLALIAGLLLGAQLSTGRADQLTDGPLPGLLVAATGALLLLRHRSSAGGR